MPILIILVAIIVVVIVGGAILDSIGNVLGLSLFAGANIIKKIRARRERKKAEKAAASSDAPGPVQIEISCPCSEKFRVNIKKPGGALMFTCPKCGQKLRVDTSKMVH